MKEFIALMALLTAMVALSIDAVLPALEPMAHDLSVVSRNDIQYVVGAFFIGTIFGQFIYGPVSDTIGRRKSLLSGIILFMIGSIICLIAPNLETMLIGRAMQGLGASGPRIMTMAMVRDKYTGREMARIMSIIMSCFILVPALAPSVGQLILMFASWHGIFILYMSYALIVFIWSYLRLDETLAPEKHRPFDLPDLYGALKEAATSRITLGYSLCSGVIFAMMLGYIHSAEQIYHEIFKVGDMFPVYFGMLALGLGAASFINSAMVRRYGMRNITMCALAAAILASFLNLVFTLYFGGNLLSFMMAAGIIFFCMGMTFGNVSTMALEPMGHIAGMASAFMASVSTLISLLIGGSIGQMYDGTILPLSVGYFALSTIALIMMFWIERGVPHSHEKPPP